MKGNILYNKNIGADLSSATGIRLIHELVVYGGKAQPNGFSFSIDTLKQDRMRGEKGLSAKFMLR
jgi:hypothetical protein